MAEGERRLGWSLRARVAVAFLVTTAVAMLALGLYVQLRVHDTLEQGLRDQLDGEMDGLTAMPPAERTRAVERLAGDIHGQVLSGDGEILASSTAVIEPLVDPDDASDGYSETHVRVLDDLLEAREGTEELEVDREEVVVLVRTIDDQVVVLAVESEHTDEAVDAVRRQLLISGPVALALAGVLGYLVAGLGLRPVERMRVRAATISSRSAGERLPVPSASELRRLALTLNAMLDRLDEGLDRERRFVADASHELRTPLALLLTEVELALSGPRSQDELVEALQSADQEVRRLIALSEDLLALAGSDAGQLQLHAEEADLAALAADVVRRFGATATAASRAVSVHADRAARVAGDPDRLGRVVSNLIDNALKHGAGDVEVRVVDGPEVVLEVSDEGPGFAEERPFERFAASHGSVGLGLAIVDEIVRAHGGRIEIAREQERTVVRVTLPAAR
ncbi:HAMP domain-containing protein [Nocardioides immobilis]|uniref:histidine kinase n=1 Tax=Nocardioides immobilis TaxID=2049295 RepID=A0A417XRX2_9ACTN|nr:ATP-binding protein [Nocardioides immobilis]RHW23224.1 HAMP domain-containing protein [Nocardioides immobilis]